MKINALCTADPLRALKICDKVVYCGKQRCDDENVVALTPFYVGLERGDIYIDSLCDEDVVENACDYLFSADARAIVRTAYDLEETGRIEAKHGLSPIMLLHKLGVLDRCTVAGGVCLDNDDLDLMAQEGTPLIVLPTADAGYGHGFAPVCAALKRGIKVGIGTYDGKYNRDASIDRETEFLRLTSNAEMSCENALTDGQLKIITAFGQTVCRK